MSLVQVKLVRRSMAVHILITTRLGSINSLIEGDSHVALDALLALPNPSVSTCDPSFEPLALNTNTRRERCILTGSVVEREHVCLLPRRASCDYSLGPRTDMSRAPPAQKARVDIRDRLAQTHEFGLTWMRTWAAPFVTCAG